MYFLCNILPVHFGTVPLHSPVDVHSTTSETPSLR